DFGVALAGDVRRLTWRHLTESIGTPYYMAPEQIRGERGDARSDLYSLGIVLYELATGSQPFRADHYLALMGQHVNALPKRPRELRPDLPPAVEAIILRLIRKRPEERYATAAETKADLEVWRTLDAAEIDPGPDRPLGGGADLIAPTSSRGMWGLVALAAGAFVAIVAVAVLLTIVLR